MKCLFILLLLKEREFGGFIGVISEFERKGRKNILIKFKENFVSRGLSAGKNSENFVVKFFFLTFEEKSRTVSLLDLKSKHSGFKLFFGFIWSESFFFKQKVILLPLKLIF